MLRRKAIRHRTSAPSPREAPAMKLKQPKSDAIVLFGASGDLAYKKIFPALYAMARRGHLQVPVIGVANSPWTTAELVARARESVERHGKPDLAVLGQMLERLAYVQGE